MIVPDWGWEILGERVVKPFLREQVNPHSYDLRLGTYVKLQRYRGEEFPNTVAKLGPDGELTFYHPIIGQLVTKKPFQPGDSVLADTIEELVLPRWLRMQGMLKSSVAREGLDHRTALYVDAGFRGTLTLELDFQRSGILLPGKRVIQVEGQIVFPRRSYVRTGRYLDQKGPTTNRAPKAIAFVARKSDIGDLS